MALSKLSSTWEQFVVSLKERSQGPNKVRDAVVVAGAIIALSSLYKIVKRSIDAKHHKELDEYFSDSYERARDEFTKACTRLNIKHKRIVIPQNSEVSEAYKASANGNNEYSIDIGFIQGSNNCKKLLMHISGTHGVEGFAGSAIQLKLLKEYIPEYLDNHQGERPHILFVHALNAYGMANHRRFNSFNIDLNRNALCDYSIAKKISENKENNNNDNDNDGDRPAVSELVSNVMKNRFSRVFNQVLKSRDSSAYLKCSYAINPNMMPYYPGGLHTLWYYWQSIKLILQYGYKTLKKVIVEGQYVLENGIFFGGKKLANEHAYFINFLCNEFESEYGINLVKTIENVSIIDVHTGLGPKGIDTLLCSELFYNDICTLFPSYAKKHNRILSAALGWYEEMYRNSIGGVSENYYKLFVNAKETISLSQEFGTVPPIIVLKALATENAIFNTSMKISAEEYNKRKAYYDKQRLECRKVFYLQDSVYWKRCVLAQGVHIFDGLLHSRERS